MTLTPSLHSSDPWGNKSSLLFGGEKHRDFETKGVDLSPVPPREDTAGMRRERELSERDASHKSSRNYS